MNRRVSSEKSGGHGSHRIRGRGGAMKNPADVSVISSAVVLLLEVLLGAVACTDLTVTTSTKHAEARMPDELY